jgi:predicted acyltransferase (DUF342 family)
MAHASSYEIDTTSLYSESSIFSDELWNVGEFCQVSRKEAQDSWRRGRATTGNVEEFGGCEADDIYLDGGSTL